MVKQKSPLSVPFFAIMGFGIILPLCLIVLYSLLASGPYGGIEWRFSPDAYWQLLWDEDFDGSIQFNWSYWAVLGRSLKLAGWCTLLCALIGFPVAYYMATRPQRQRRFWVFLLTVPFWTNLLIRTYAWILLLRTEGVLNTLLEDLGLISAPLELLYTDFAVGVGLVYAALPYMVLPIFACLERLDWRLVEAAQDLYAPRWRVLLQIVLPAVQPGLVAGGILVFVPSIGAFLAPDLLGGEKQLMLGTLLQQQFGFGRNWPLGSALTVVLILMVVVSFVVLEGRRKAGERLPQ